MSEEQQQETVPDPSPLMKIWDWCKLVWATKKLMLAVWTFFFGVTGTAIVGNVNETNPWKFGDDVPRETRPAGIPEHTHDLTHTHDWVMPDHSHEMPLHEHGEKAHKHADHVHADHSHPVQPHTHDDLPNLVPPNHLELH